MLFDSFLTIVLVFLNGFFVAAEFALVKIRMSQLEMRIQLGSRLAKLAKSILENLDAYLSASQLGITLASLALGWIGESVVSRLVMNSMNGLGVQVEPELAHSIAAPVAFVVITVLHIILGEQAPKWFAIQRPEVTTMAVAIPMKVFYTVFKPFIWVLNKMANGLLSAVGIEPAHEQDVHTAEELRYLLEQSKESGAIESTEHELIKNVFALAERTAKQVMVTRTNIHGIEVSTPVEELIERVIEEGYSRLPIYRDTIDNVVGIVVTKDILTMIQHKELIVLQDILRPPYFVPETKNISDLLKEFQRRRIHVAIVLDEFGGTAGMITLEDILEELVGDILDEYDEDITTFEHVTRNEFVVKAATPIAEINTMLPAPLPEGDHYETVGGLMNVLFGKIPEPGCVIQHGGYECTVLDSTRRTVELVRLRYLQAQELQPQDTSPQDTPPQDMQGIAAEQSTTEHLQQRTTTAVF
jgi:CBS domain containing-hemolysin-like protein